MTGRGDRLIRLSQTGAAALALLLSQALHAHEATAASPPGRSQAASTAPSGTQYHPLPPARLLDTRNGTGGITGALGAGASVAVQVANRGGVPADGAAAVAVNVTVVDTTAPSWLAVFPDGTAFSGTSTLNWVPGEIRANMAIVPLGADGALRLLNLTGWTDVVMDVLGYFATPAAGDTGGLFRPLAAARILDTRYGPGTVGLLGPQQTTSFQVGGQGNVPASGVSAVILNVTVTDVSSSTYVSCFPAGLPFPGTSTVNLVPGQTSPNRVIVKLGSGGQVSLYNNAGLVDLVVDVAGWFTDGSDPTAAGGAFTPVQPYRVLDTRTGVTLGTIPPHVMEAFPVGGTGSVPASGVSGLALNVTEVNPNTPAWLAVFPDGDWVPLASDLNFVPGEVHPNATVVKVGSSGRLVLDTNAGTVDVVVDVFGWFSTAPEPGPPPGAPAFSQASAVTPFSVSVTWSRPASTGGGQLVSYAIASSPDDGLWPVQPGATSAVLTGLRCGVAYTFLITATNGAGTGPASAPIGASTSCTHTIGNVTYYRQVYGLSCEEASLQMALSHEGIAVSQAQELNDIGIDYRPAYYDSGGTLHWGDPYTSFVGDPNGSEAALTGYGTFYPTIARIAGQYGGQVVAAREGIAAADVYSAVLNDHPVVAWVSFDWNYHGPGAWLAFDGRWVQYHGPIEHTVTVVGVTGTDVYVFNPWFGPQWVSRATFEAAYSTFNSMAVVIG